MIRAYVETDLKRTAMVWLRSGQDEYHYLPAFQKLDGTMAVDVFRRVIQGDCSIWVYESASGICGFMGMKNNLIDRLYVDPAWQGSGIGSMFIGHAKALYLDGLILKTHQQNKRACEFYEKRGFRSVAYGVSPPPESMPDVEYRWP
jgi:putative acetyltransferase